MRQRQESASRGGTTQQHTPASTGNCCWLHALPCTLLSSVRTYPVLAVLLVCVVPQHLHVLLVAYGQQAPARDALLNSCVWTGLRAGAGRVVVRHMASLQQPGTLQQLPSSCLHHRRIGSHARTFHHLVLAP
jgi:hypothetical protein